jgi:hypothetical protein
MSAHGRCHRISALVALALTALYWIWESRAGGNIRVDLLLIYPALLFCYLISLWPRFRYWSIPIAVSLMAVNFVYFVISYRLFDKHPG